MEPGSAGARQGGIKSLTLRLSARSLMVSRANHHASDLLPSACPSDNTYLNIPFCSWSSPHTPAACSIPLGPILSQLLFRHPTKRRLE